jgi:hypothetical protein
LLGPGGTFNIVERNFHRHLHDVTVLKEEPENNAPC